MILKGVFHGVLNYLHRLFSLGNVPIHSNREAVGACVGMCACVHVYVNEYM